VPVPDGFWPEATKTVSGVFVRAVDYDDGHFGLQDSLDAVEKACIARGRTLDYVGDVRHHENTEYWLYRSGNETVVFVSRVKAHIEVEHCRVTFEEKRDIMRSATKAGAWPSPFRTRGRMCAGSRWKCYSTTKFGIKARCRSDGDSFQVYRDCVSIDRGPSRGMLLESVYESDDMNGSGFQISELQSDALIDASVFDPSRSW